MRALVSRLQILLGLSGSKSKAETREQADTDSELPWHAGAREWSERYGTIREDRRFFMRTTAIALVVAAVAVLSAISLAREAKFIPYVVQVDQHGYGVAIKPAEKESPLSQRVILGYATRWIRAMRTVIGNETAQRQLAGETYAMILPGSDAHKTANEWFKAHNPLADIGSRTVAVEIEKVYPKGDPLVVAVEWTERITERGREQTKRFFANIAFTLSKGTSSGYLKTDEIEANPAGLYVQYYSISLQ